MITALRRFWKRPTIDNLGATAITDPPIQKMSWPYFAELGKNAMDIFQSGYNTGSFTLGVRSKTSTEVEISSNIVTNLDTYNASGALQTKLKTNCGTFVLKLDTENRFSTEVTFQDMLAQGTQLTLDCSFAPQEDYKSGHVRSSYINDVCSLSADLDTKVGNPTLIASAVAGRCCWLGGIQAMFDLKNKKMIGNSIAVGYLANDFAFHSALHNGNELSGSVYQKVNSNLDIGILIAASSVTNEAELGLGCRYKVDPEATVYAKGHSRGEMGIGYQQTLHEGVTLCLSTSCNISDTNIGECKLGVALDFKL